MAKVIARIDKKTGNLTLEVNGVKGEPCVDVISFIAEHGEVKEETHTDEYYEVNDLPDYISNM